MGPYRFHAHTLEEIDLACRLWGAQGMQQMLDDRAPAERLQAEVVADAARTPERAARRRGSGVWSALWRALRPRSPRAGSEHEMPQGST